MKYTQLHNESFLLNGLVSGNADAFTKIYTAYHPLVYGLAHSLLKSSQPAEDVCSEVFTALWQNRAALADVQSIKAYLLIAARNRAINALKAMARSQCSLEEVCKAFEQKSFDAEAALLEKEYTTFVRKKLNELPPRAKEVFSLCRDEGLSYEQVSSKLRISRNAVKGHMVYSLKKLKAFVEKDLGIPACLLLLLLHR